MYHSAHAGASFSSPGGEAGMQLAAFSALLTSCAAGALQVGEGEFGIVYKAKYLGTMVAVKVLKNNDAVALGDFR
jgi:hypothetical protein